MSRKVENEKPTLQSILDEQSAREQYYGVMKARWKVCERAYDGDITIKIEDGFEKYIPPTGSAMVDTEVDHLITRNPVVNVPPKSETKVAQETADKVEKLHQSTLTHNTVNSPQPPAKVAGKHAGIYGMFCFKGPVVDMKAFEKSDYFERRYAFLFKAINPMNLLPAPSLFWGGTGSMIEVKKKTIGEIQFEYPDFEPKPLEKGQYKDTDKLDFLEWWDNDWRGFVTDGQLLNVIPNVYHYVPYEMGFSGLGRIGDNPEDLAVGLLWKVMGALEIEARTMSALDAIVQTHAFPKYDVEMDPAKIAGGMAKGPGGVSYIPKDANLHFREVPNIPPFLYDHLGNIRQDIRLGTSADVARGERPVGVSTGYQQRMLVSEVQLKFGDVLDALQYKLSLILAKTVYLMEKVITKPVSVWGKVGQKSYEDMIKPDDIKGHYYCTVDLSSTKPEEEERVALAGFQMWKGGGITKKRFWEKYLRISDITTEEDQEMVERVMGQPKIIEAISAAAAEQWGMDAYIKQVTEQAKQQAAAQGMGGMNNLGMPQEMAGEQQGLQTMDAVAQQQAMLLGQQQGPSIGAGTNAF